MSWQPPAVLPIDAQMWGVEYIRAALNERSEDAAFGVYVGITSSPMDPVTRKPTRRPRMVVVTRDGGAPRGVFDFPRLRVRVWAANDQDANKLAALVLALFRMAPGNGPCAGLTVLSGPTDIPDESKQPQRYLLLEAKLRGVPL